jgi:hypothetical protein
VEVNMFRTVGEMLRESEDRIDSPTSSGHLETIFVILMFLISFMALLSWGFFLIVIDFNSNYQSVFLCYFTTCIPCAAFAVLTMRHAAWKFILSTNPLAFMIMLLIALRGRIWRGTSGPPHPVPVPVSRPTVAPPPWSGDMNMAPRRGAVSAPTPEPDPKRANRWAGMARLHDE